MFLLFEYIQQGMIFLGNGVLNILVLIVFPVFYCQLGASVASFKLNFVVDLVRSENAWRFSPSVKLSEGSCRYFVDFHVWLGLLAREPLVHVGG